MRQQLEAKTQADQAQAQRKAAQQLHEESFKPKGAGGGDGRGGGRPPASFGRDRDRDRGYYGPSSRR